MNFFTIYDFFAQALNMVGVFHPRMLIFLFLLCLIGEGGPISIPVVLETTWLLVGYQFSVGAYSVIQLLAMLATAQVARLTGAFVLYYLSRHGSQFLARYSTFIRRWLEQGTDPDFKLFNRINLLSPVSVALGRLIGLRIPLTFFLGCRGKLKVLLLSVMLSSLAWDGTYLVVGAVVGTAVKPTPIQMLFYILGSVVLISALSFAIRQVMNVVMRRRENKTPGEDACVVKKEP